MDYRTLFFANIASVSVFVLCMVTLAWRNRQVKGLGWFAGALAMLWLKLALQGLEGRVPPIVSGMVANELYLISIAMQMLGLRWFVLRTPVRTKWMLTGMAAILGTYSALFLLKISYSGNVINLPFIAFCGWSVWLLLKHGRGPFAAVSSVAAAVLCGEMVVAGYRAALTNFRYTRPWETVHAESDPRWLYSLAAMFFFATFMVMCEIWFLVTELQRELAEQARTDSLTGALNRRALEEAASRESARSMRSGHPLCMIMLDVDQFKLLNDKFGHAAGDCALQALVQKSRSMLRQQDLLARTGGEEFTILLPDTPARAGVEVAERIRQAIEQMEVQYEGGHLRFTVSMGVAQLEPIPGNWEGMMRRADIAMYEAKEHGRNKVAVQIPDAVGMTTL
ncbi:MAG: GGDEF domain-containing protein [Acidobacteriaceae bacterium]|nr:GGDEF domain-containing protein [Acidobacteriaceae bacterium]